MGESPLLKVRRKRVELETPYLMACWVGGVCVEEGSCSHFLVRRYLRRGLKEGDSLSLCILWMMGSRSNVRLEAQHENVSELGMSAEGTPLQPKFLEINLFLTPYASAYLLKHCGGGFHGMLCAVSSSRCSKKFQDDSIMQDVLYSTWKVPAKPLPAVERVYINVPTLQHLSLTQISTLLSHPISQIPKSTTQAKWHPTWSPA
jgi:hypothetical protein